MWWPRPVPALGAVKALLILCTLLAPSQAVVRAVLDSNLSMVDFADLPALFGVPLAPEGVQGYLMEAKPANACQPIQGPWRGDGSLGAIVPVCHHDCAFDVKVLHAQQAGFRGAIIHNVGSDDLVHVTPVYKDLQLPIVIPSVFVGESASRELRVIMHCDKSAHVFLLHSHPDIPLVLVLFWALNYTMALLPHTLLILQSLWNWLWAWRTRGSVVKMRAHRKAQVRPFTGCHDLCAICLDEYEEGDQLKVLPCSHMYHCNCIDTWFSQATQRSCPVCRQSVASTDDGSDSSAESFDDENPVSPGRRPPIWAIQA
ncbi:hypothetical protein MC885_000797 [Smutsia gigantea]|nr:hypothetical protein MC885_000797 [Smutsia gigantea]